MPKPRSATWRSKETICEANAKPRKRGEMRGLLGSKGLSLTLPRLVRYDVGPGLVWVSPFFGGTGERGGLFLTLAEVGKYEYKLLLLHLYLTYHSNGLHKCGPLVAEIMRGRLC